METRQRNTFSAIVEMAKISFPKVCNMRMQWTVKFSKEITSRIRRGAPDIEDIFIFKRTAKVTETSSIFIRLNSEQKRSAFVFQNWGIQNDIISKIISAQLHPELVEVSRKVFWSVTSFTKARSAGMKISFIRLNTR